MMLAAPRIAPGVAAVAALVAAGLAAAFIPGCSLAEYDSVNPVEVPSPDLEAGASTGGAAPVAPRVRTVGTRSPWSGVPGNLLLDGDFELSAGATGANLPGWQAFGGGAGYADISFETGGLCRSGLHCAVVERGMALLGWGVAADGAGMQGSIWVKVPEGASCSIVTVGIVLWSQFTLSSLFSSEQPSPDAAGWCRYARSIPPQGEATLLYLEVDLQSGERALVDDARLVPATGAAPMSHDSRQATPAERARARAAVEWVKRRIRYGTRPGAARPRAVD